MGGAVGFVSLLTLGAVLTANAAKCPVNEHYVSCVSEDCWPKTCAEEDDVIQCPSADNTCKGGCVCDRGFLRAENQTCIPGYQCPHKSCPENEIYLGCLSGQCKPKLCSDVGKSLGCPFAIGWCPGGCLCVEGFLRDALGVCVPERDCPENKCPENEMFVSCALGECRPKLCSDVGKSLACPRVLQPCAGGCLCVQGYLRNAAGVCVKERECRESLY